jgi:hypothetical protein
MDRYRRRIAMLFVGAKLGCPVRRRIEGEIEIARPVEIVSRRPRSRTPTRFFFSRVLQPFVVNLLGTTVYQDMRQMEELFRNSNPPRDGGDTRTMSPVDVAHLCGHSRPPSLRTAQRRAGARPRS